MKNNSMSNLFFGGLTLWETYIFIVKVLVYASDLEEHARYHSVDPMDAKDEELKEKMTELIRKDPTLDPSVVIDTILNNFTEGMDGNSRSELLAVFYRTKRESHLRWDN